MPDLWVSGAGSARGRPLDRLGLEKSRGARGAACPSKAPQEVITQLWPYVARDNPEIGGGLVLPPDL